MRRLYHGSSALCPEWYHVHRMFLVDPIDPIGIGHLRVPERRDQVVRNVRLFRVLR